MRLKAVVAVSPACTSAPPSRTTREGGAAPHQRYWLHAPAALFAASVLVACASDPATTSLGAGATASAGQQAASGSGASGSSAAAAGGGAGLTGSQAGAAGAAGTGKLSFANDIYPRVIRSRCASCHNDAPSFGGLAFFPGMADFAYGNLVNVPAGNEEKYRCKGIGLVRVAPGDPEHSLMYLKLTVPPCGSKMPPIAFAQASQEQVDLVRQWIVEGAAP